MNNTLVRVFHLSPPKHLLILCYIWVTAWSKTSTGSNILARFNVSMQDAIFVVYQTIQPTFPVVVLVVWLSVAGYGVDGWAEIQPTDQNMLSVCASMQMGTEMGSSGIEGHGYTAQNLMPGPKRPSPFYIQVYTTDGKFNPDEEFSGELLKY